MVRKYEKISTGLNPYLLNKIDNDFIYLYKNVGMVNEMVERSKNTLEEAEKINAEYESTNDRLDNIIADSGTSSTEVVDARIDAEGKEYTVLKDRLDEKEQNFNTQLARTERKAKSGLTVFSERKRPVVTFLDDDTRSEVLTRLKPIFDEKGVPCSIAAITGRFDDAAHLNAQEIKGLQDDGWEVLGHTYTHPTGQSGLLEYAGDYARLEYEISEGCKDVLLENGINVNGFVYPQGGSDFDIREITKKHYDYAFAATRINDDSLMDTMKIGRIAFGAFTNINPTVNGNSEKNTLAYYKACVDYAVDNNAWLVFMTHIAATPESEDTVLSQLIDYIKSLDIDILNAGDAYKIHGNRYFAGDIEEQTYFVIDKNNKTHIGKKGSNLNYRHMLFSDFSPTLTIDTPITAFPENSKTAVYLTGKNAVNNGFPTSGILYIERHMNDDFSTREFWSYKRNLYYRSYWDGTSWTPFKKVYDDEHYMPTSNRVNANTLPSEMTETQKERPFWTKILDSNSTGFPESKAGLIYTDVTRGDPFNYQIYHVYDSNRIYKRYFDGTVWSEWDLIGGSFPVWEYLKEWEVDVGTVGANSVKTFPISSGMFVFGDSLVVNPKFSLPLGLNYNAYINANGTATLIVSNPTTSEIACPADTWMFRVIKNG